MGALRLSIEHMTVLGLDPGDIITVGESCGAPFVSLILDSGRYRLPLRSFLGHAGLVSDIGARLRSSPVKVHAAEGFLIDGTDGLDRHKRLLDIAARLGIERGIVLIVDPDRARATADFAALCALAEPLGLQMSIEFVATTEVPALVDAALVVRKSGCANAAISVDILHLVRSGGSPGDLKASGGPFGAAQLCDGPLSLPRDQWNAEGLGGRLLPGEGEFPVVEFIAALPDDLVLGIEVPRGLVASIDDGVAIARSAIVATRRLTDRLA